MSFSFPKSQSQTPGINSPAFPLPDPEPTIIPNDNSDSAVKRSDNQPYLDAPLRSTLAQSSDTISDITAYSSDNDNERQTGQLLTRSLGDRLPSTSPLPPGAWKRKSQTFWLGNKGLILVTLAQFFGVTMSVATRLLEMDGPHGPGMHPFQVLHPLILPETDRIESLVDTVRPDDWYFNTQWCISMAS